VNISKLIIIDYYSIWRHNMYTNADDEVQYKAAQMNCSLTAVAIEWLNSISVFHWNRLWQLGKNMP